MTGAAARVAAEARRHSTATWLAVAAGAAFACAHLAAAQNHLATTTRLAYKLNYLDAAAAAAAASGGHKAVVVVA